MNHLLWTQIFLTNIYLQQVWQRVSSFDLERKQSQSWEPPADCKTVILMLLMLKARMEWIVVDLSITPSWLSSALKSTRARFFAARSDLKETRLQSRKIFLLCSEPVFNRTSLCLPSPLPPALVLTLPLTLFLSALNHRPVLNYKRQTVQFQL